LFYYPFIDRYDFLSDMYGKIYFLASIATIFLLTFETPEILIWKKRRWPMALIEWDNNMSVNVEEIDMQHKKLVAMINQLNDAMAKRKGRDVLGSIIDGLVSYATTHFATEEKYFDMFKYPDAPSHKKEHTDFVKRVGEFQDGFKKGDLALTIEVMRFLKDWLTKHILGTDKKYGPYFNEKGLK